MIFLSLYTSFHLVSASGAVKEGEDGDQIIYYTSEALATIHIVVRSLGLNTVLCLSGYVGAATVAAAAWWFLYCDEGPMVTFHQLVCIAERFLCSCKKQKKQIICN